MKIVNKIKERKLNKKIQKSLGTHKANNKIKIIVIKG